MFLPEPLYILRQLASSLNYHKVVTHTSPGLPALGLPWEKSPQRKILPHPQGARHHEGNWGN
jgi:hypothetical protein